MGASFVAMGLSLVFGLLNIQGRAISDISSAPAQGKGAGPGLSAAQIGCPKVPEQSKYDVKPISKRLDGERENRSMPYAEESVENALRRLASPERQEWT